MNRLTKRTLLSTAIAVATFQAHGAGFQISEHSASGLGRAFAGEAAIADNAAVAARNPAAMTMFDSAQVSGGLSFIQPDVDATVDSSVIAGGNTVFTDSSTNSDVAPNAFVPNIHYVRPIDDKMAIGLSAFSNFGLSTEYPTDSAAALVGGQTELATVDFNLNFAYEVSPQVSLGAGINAVYADAELKRQSGIVSNLGTGSASDNVANIAGDGWGFGWNVGALWQINENHRLGLAYRSEVDITLEGDFTGTTSGGLTVPGELELNLPDVFEFSGFHKLDPKWAIHYSVMRTGWSSFQEIRATSAQCLNGECLQKDEKWDDSWRYAFGATHYLNNQWILRVGYAKDESPVPDEYRTLSIPDTERDWYTIGATYLASENLTFDAGFAYLNGKDVNGVESETIQTGVEASYDFTAGGDAYIYALSANYTF